MSLECVSLFVFAFLDQYKVFLFLFSFNLDQQIDQDLFFYGMFFVRFLFAFANYGLNCLMGYNAFVLFSLFNKKDDY